jgi:hypothetical protein
LNEMSTLRKMLLPDADSSHSLSTAFAARSGSGKTTLLTHLVSQARKDTAFKETRFVYVSIKQEHLFGEKVPVVSSVDDLLKQMEKEPIVTFYPKDAGYYEEDIDEIIESMFSISDDVKGGIVLMIDDANVLKGFDSRGQPSPSVKKLTIAGRSKGIRGVYILHRISNLPRLMNGNLSGMVLLSISSMDLPYSKKITGIELDSLLPELVDYKWAYVDLIHEQIHRFNPVEVKKP